MTTQNSTVEIQQAPVGMTAEERDAMFAAEDARVASRVVENSSLEKVLLEMGRDKIRRQQLQLNWEIQTAIDESKRLAKISRVLITVWNLPKMILALSRGHSLVITEFGDIYTGKVKTDKLTLQNEKLSVAGKNRDVFDVAPEQSMSTTWWVPAPGATFKNAWNIMRRNKTYDTLPAVELFMDILSTASPDRVTYEAVVDRTAGSTVTFSIEGISMKLVVSATSGKARAMIVDGKTIPV